MRVLTLFAPGLPFILNQPAPTPAAQSVKAKVIEIRPFTADGIFGEVVCKAENLDDLIIVHVVDFGGGAAFVETKMTQAEYNAELVKSLADGDDAGDGAGDAPPTAPLAS